MPVITQIADSQARVHLPLSFANSTVLIEQISETELRICQVSDTPEVVPTFAEEAPVVLSERDRELFLELLANPPQGDAALLQLAASQAQHRD